MSTLTPLTLILLRPEQVAEILGQTVQTLAAWRRRGCGPPYVRVSAIVVRYPQHEFEKWLAERTASSTAEEVERRRRARKP